MIQVRLLGGLAIMGGSREVELPRKVRALAGYLAWQQGAWVDRDRLRGLLWGESDERRASQSLRTAMHALRRGLDQVGSLDGLLETRRDALRLVDGPSCRVDARLFEAHAREGMKGDGPATTSLISAAALYQGDFMAAMDSSFHPQADWLPAERRRLDDLHITVLRTLVERLVGAGLSHAATDYAVRWRDADPLSEQACRAIMELYASLGQSARAAEEFERCRCLLKEELDVAPSPETEALRRTLGLVGAESPPRGTNAPGPLPQATAPGRQATPGASGEAGSTSAFPRMPCAEPPEASRAGLSRDPRRNAGMLLVCGEQKVQVGQVEEGLGDLENALAALRKLGDDQGEARARLILAGALLMAPTGPKPDQALAHVEPAVEHYRTKGPSPDLCRALNLLSEAHRELFRFGEAIASAEEGIEVARRIGARDAETRLYLSLALANLMDYRFAESKAAFEHALHDAGRLYQPPEVMRALMCRAQLASGMGDVYDAEAYAREALAIGAEMPRSPLMLQALSGMRFGLMMILHGQDRHEEVRQLRSSPDERRFLLPGQRYLEDLMLMEGDGRAIIGEVSAWLQGSLPTLPPWWADAYARLLIELMLAEGMDREAAKWAALAHRRAQRLQRGPGGEVYALCQRAAALARLGRVEQARACRKQLIEMATGYPGQWVPVWTAYVDGLIASRDGDVGVARRHLEKAKSQFNKIGVQRLARLVDGDLQRLEDVFVRKHSPSSG